MIVLDTNVISELMKATPAERVMNWVGGQPLSTLCTTSNTQAEILHGIMLLPSGKRRVAIAAAADAMFAVEFGGRILAFDSDATHPYARIATARRRAGHPISHFDAQIAAIAHAAGATVATRNVVDFEGCGVKIVNPWVV